MKGFQLTFFTQQDRRHQGRRVAEWLIETAKALGVRGATEITGTEGFGRHHKIHSAHFFELADQPVEITMAVSEEEADRLFARINAEDVRVFYVKAPVEFGVAGKAET